MRLFDATVRRKLIVNSLSADTTHMGVYIIHVTTYMYMSVQTFKGGGGVSLSD